MTKSEANLDEDMIRVIEIVEDELDSIVKQLKELSNDLYESRKKYEQHNKNRNSININTNTNDIYST